MPRYTGSSLHHLRTLRHRTSSTITYLEHQISLHRREIANLDALIESKTPKTLTLAEIEQRLGHKVIIKS